jgi:hypothetical protein
MATATLPGPRVVRSAVVQAVASYLASHPWHEAAVNTEGPLVRPTHLNPSTWRRWFVDGGRPWNRGRLGPATGDDLLLAELASATVAGFPRAAGRGFHVVMRADLVALARIAAGGVHDDRVRLMVATMVWGAGKEDGRRPRLTAKGLRDRKLARVLEDSAANVGAGRLRDAWNSCVPLDGWGEAYFTKWLWAVGLGCQKLPITPLIYDDRVKWALALVALNIRGGYRHGDAGDYEDYISLLHDVAGDLRDGGFAQVNAEKLEWLLFDRHKSHPATNEKCFVDWLRAAAAPDVRRLLAGH